MSSITIQYISDLHDKYPDIEPKCKYLALLGDIGNPFSRSYKNFIKQMSSKFEKVFIISGNHEYYCNTISSTDNRIEEICDETPNCIYFNNKSIFLDGFLIVGSTLWSNIDDKTVDYMNDFKYIYESPKDLLTPYTYRLKHHTSVEFIKSQIDKNMPTIVLTHHAPHKIMNGKYINSGFCSGFTTDLVHLNKNNNVKCWLSGHTHQCITVLLNGIICSSNCLGYTNEGVENFELNKVLKVNS